MHQPSQPSLAVVGVVDFESSEDGEGAGPAVVVGSFQQLLQQFGWCSGVLQRQPHQVLAQEVWLEGAEPASAVVSCVVGRDELAQSVRVLAGDPREPGVQVCDARRAASQGEARDHPHRGGLETAPGASLGRSEVLAPVAGLVLEDSFEHVGRVGSLAEHGQERGGVQQQSPVVGRVIEVVGDGGQRAGQDLRVGGGCSAELGGPVCLADQGLEQLGRRRVQERREFGVEVVQGRPPLAAVAGEQDDAELASGPSAVGQLGEGIGEPSAALGVVEADHGRAQPA